MNLKLLALAAPLALVGCDFVNDQKLNMAHQEYMQECFGNLSNSCNDKAVDYNLMALEALQDEMIEVGSKRLNLKGDSVDRFEKHVEKSIEKVAEHFEKIRPGFFSRVFLGGFQPFDGKSIQIISGSDISDLGTEIVAEYARKLVESKQEYEKMWANMPPLVSGVPAPVEPIKKEPIQAESASQDVAVNGLKVAADAAIGEHTLQDTASEYGEARSYLQVDIDGNGSTDAVVMYTLEPTDGGNYSNQYLVPFIHNGDRWEAKARLDIINSATDLADEGNGVLSYVELARGPDDPDCCPSQKTTRLYKWNGSVLQDLKNDGASPAKTSSKPLAKSPYYSVLTLNNPLDDNEELTKRVLECSMASKLVGQLESIDIISDKFNRISLEKDIAPDVELFAQYHAMIKKDWSLKDMNRAEQDEYLVGIYNSEFCQQLHGRPKIQVSDVPAE